MAFRESIFITAFCIILSSIPLGCATFNPRPLSEAAFHERTQTQTENDIRVSAAVLRESGTLFNKESGTSYSLLVKQKIKNF